MATAAMKNWEAQARTNSILAGSLKALEERVDEVVPLLDWRTDVEIQFEGFGEKIAALEASFEAYKLQERQSKAAQKRWGGIAGFGGGGGSGSFKAPSATAIVPVGDQIPDEDKPPKPPLFEVAYKYVQENWRVLLLFLSIATQALICVGIIMVVALGSDEAEQFIGALMLLSTLGLASLGFSAGLSSSRWVPGAKVDRTTLNGVIGMMPLVVGLSAVLMQLSARSLEKLSRYCSAEAALGARPDWCGPRESRTRAAVAQAAIVAACAVYCAFWALEEKDRVRDANRQADLDAAITRVTAPRKTVAMGLMAKMKEAGGATPLIGGTTPANASTWSTPGVRLASAPSSKMLQD